MLGDLITAIDRLIEFVKTRREHQDRAFEKLVQPLFLDMTSIHTDYKNAFHDLSFKIDRLRFDEPVHRRVDGEWVGEKITRDDIVLILEQRKTEYDHLRTSVRSLMDEIGMAECHTTGDIQTFIFACFCYFLPEPESQIYASAICNIRNSIEPTAFRALSKKDLDWLGDYLHKVLDRLDHGWSDITKEYAHLRVQNAVS